jgi:DNA-binding CsgD family transcriptional regulator
MLLARRGRGDAERAAALLAAAGRIAHDHALTALLAHIDELTTTPATVTTLPDGLTTRELAVLQLIAQGRSNRAIGRELSISEHTAANHVRSILMKTTSANRAEAASYAHRHRLAAPPDAPLRRGGEAIPPYPATPLLATPLQPSPDAIDEIESTDTVEDTEWLPAFLSADRLACYCLYQSACPRLVL